MASGVVCSQALEFFKPAMERFLENLQRYAELMEWDDLPHYYNERATLSLLAGAAWQSGMIASEEYVSTKGKRDDAIAGRADLWAYCPTSEQAISIEAKQRWPTMGVETNTIIKGIDDAEADILKINHGDVRVGLTFFAPSFKRGCREADVVNLAYKICDVAVKHGIDGFIWWMPPQALEHYTPNRKGEPRCWPALLTTLRISRLDGKVVRKSSRLSGVDMNLAVPA